MTEETNPLFQHLVAMLATSALHHMGALPGDEGQEPDVEAASTTIDMLDMLAAKTKGNLAAEEDKMLNDALSSLKMAFVQVQGQGSAPPPSEEATAEDVAQAEAAPQEESPELEVPDTDREEKEPKFHKRYD